MSDSACNAPAGGATHGGQAGRRDSGLWARARRKHVVYVVTSDVSADVLLRGQLAHLQQRGFEVSLVCGQGPRVAGVAEREGVRCHALPLQREVSAAGDLRSLFELTLLLRRLSPDVVNASTPKAALLGLLAAFFAGVPHRVYLLRGLRLETLSPLGQLAMQGIERLCSALAHRVVCVSPSLREAYLERGLAPREKCLVLGSGSSNGIDCERFTPSAALEQRASALAAELGLKRESPTLGFIGRPVRDKGIGELRAAFQRVRERLPDAQLLIVGAGFAGDAECEQMQDLRGQSGVFVVGSVADVAPYYCLMHVLAFPSYREGFPNVVLEASCMGLPVVAFDATGVKDAIVHDATGVVCPMHDVRAFSEETLRYLEDPERARAHGEAGARRAREEFSRERVWDAVVRFYRELCPSSAEQDAISS